MNARTLVLLALSGLLLTDLAWAQVEVRILAAPERVYSFEPVPVVFEARNEGAAGLAIPAEGSGGEEGGYLEIGPTGEELEIASLIHDGVPRRLVWLEPGERWLFLQDVAPGSEGRFDIRAVLRSLGQCTGRPVGPHRQSIKAVREVGLVVPSRPNDCWEGEARSERLTVTVQVPDTEVDRSAAEFLELDHVRWKNNWKASLIYQLRELFERFPTSHYTYAAFKAAGDYPSMLNVVILQPDNPLNPWVAGAMAAGRAHRRRPCAPPSEERPGGPPDLAHRYERVIASYPPPKPLQDYLRQQALEHANEECPEPGKADDAKPPS